MKRPRVTKSWLFGATASARRLLDMGAVAAVLAALCGCSNISRFDTGEHDAYCGTIVAAPFVRQGLDRSLQAELHLATASLHTDPGTLTTHRGSTRCNDEPLFQDARLRSPSKLESDPLSMLEFGQGRELNFMSWVDSKCDGTYLAVVSLMHDDTVELRLLRGQLDSSEREVGPLGVFPLTRGRRGCDND